MGAMVMSRSKYLPGMEDDNKPTVFNRMDAGIKFLLVFVLSIMPFLYRNQLSLGIICAYMLAVTLFSGIRARFLMKIVMAYAFFIVLPCAFGMFIESSFIFTGPNHVVAAKDFGTAGSKVLELFLAWYAWSVYFLTTPIRSMIGMLGRILFPLKKIGVPVPEYLRLVNCISHELTESAQRLRDSYGDIVRSIIQKDCRRYRFNVKDLSGVLVSIIVESFSRLDRIQESLASVDPRDLYTYRFRFTAVDALAAASVMLLAAVLAANEKGFLR